MAKAVYFGVSSKARKVKKMYIGVDGVAHKIKKAYIGVNGVARLFFSSGLPLSSLPHGALVRINENNSLVSFYTSKHDYESGLNGTGRTLMVRQYCYDQRGWLTSWSSYNDTFNHTFADTELDTWLNGNYKSLLDSKVQELMGETSIYHTNVKTITTMKRAVFLLSATELGSINAGNIKFNAEGTVLPISETLRIAYNSSGSAVNQQTRTPVTGINISSTAVVDNYTCVGMNNGYLGANTPDQLYWVRPCFTLPSTLEVDSTPNADGSYNLLI